MRLIAAFLISLLQLTAEACVATAATSTPSTTATSGTTASTAATTTTTAASCDGCTANQVTVEMENDGAGPFASITMGTDANGCSTLAFTCTDAAGIEADIVVNDNAAGTFMGDPTVTVTLTCDTMDNWRLPANGADDIITMMECDTIGNA